MGMSSYVYGIKKADKKFKEMLEVYNTCKKAGVTIPKEVIEYFNDETPDEKGVIVDLSEHECFTEGGDDGRDFFNVDIDKLPKDIKIIRFVNSY